MVATGTGNQGKPGKMGRHFPVREKSGNFFKTGKVREFYSKYWKNRKILHWKIEENTGKVREICQPILVKTLQIWYHILNFIFPFEITYLQWRVDIHNLCGLYCGIQCISNLGLLTNSFYLFNHLLSL